ncbi:MAG: PEP-CTERM sorting domain-containing protein [Fimbriimonadaceae bacterium]|nr:PEP-CTERM sorting domain-containing protein [Fimbriimonadaceae bacterium]
MRIRTFTILGLAFFALPGAHAAIAFNNFGAGDSFNTGSGGTIGGSSSQVGYIIQGNGFNSLATGQISTITLGYGHVTGTNSTTFRLFGGTAGSVGSFITSWTVTNSPAFGSGGLVVINNTDALATLNSGTDYWLIAEAASDAWQAWNNNNIGDVGPHAVSNDGGATYGIGNGSRNVFRVEVEPVPEPASMAVLGIGALALIRRRRSRKA